MQEENNYYNSTSAVFSKISSLLKSLTEQLIEYKHDISSLKKQDAIEATMGSIMSLSKSIGGALEDTSVELQNTIKKFFNSRSMFDEVMQLAEDLKTQLVEL